MRQAVRNIIDTLRVGPSSSTELAQRLGVNSSTITRQLGALGEQVIRAGRGRATRWYLSRNLPLLPGIARYPVYRVNTEGKTEKIAILHVVYPTNTYLVEYFRAKTDGRTKSEWSYYESLPWWLTDMRPQGFLGRLFAQELRNLGEQVDLNPLQWNEDLTLAILVKYPQNNVGNLLIGEPAYATWLASGTPKLLSDLAAGERAEAITRGVRVDSSAQGEQPKFTARLMEGECLIKFSGQVIQREIDSVAGRWADLLQAEALAARELNEVWAGIAAENRSFIVNQRTLMASPRFDRTPQGGRIGVISFFSLDLEFVGKASESWPVIADTLRQAKVITELAVTQTKVAWAFGQLIANSDMHLGNISVLNRSGRPYELAPIYDMLPMHFAPRANGDIPQQPRTISLNGAVPRVCWEQAHIAAISFWHNVLTHQYIGTHFKLVAEQQLEKVEEFAAIIHKMA